MNTNKLSYVTTYIIPNARRDLEEAFRFSACVDVTTHFVYCTKTKKIYEIISDQYKFVAHEEIIGHFGLNKDNCYKFDIDMEYGRYKTFKHYLGIRWLQLSDIYNALPKELKDLEEYYPLSHQDIERIKNYVDNERRQFILKVIELDGFHALEDDIRLLGIEYPKKED